VGEVVPRRMVGPQAEAQRVKRLPGPERGLQDEEDWKQGEDDHGDQEGMDKHRSRRPREEALSACKDAKPCRRHRPCRQRRAELVKGRESVLGYAGLSTLKVTMALRIVAGRIAGLRRGTVMRQNLRHEPAPSTAAASYMSLGMLCSAPRMTTMKKG